MIMLPYIRHHKSNLNIWEKALFILTEEIVADLEADLVLPVVLELKITVPGCYSSVAVGCTSCELCRLDR